MLIGRLTVLWVALAALLAATPPSAAQPPAATPPSAAQPPAAAPPNAGQPRTPAPTPLVIDIQGSPVLGPENAPVTIVEFGDFQCPFCAQGAKGLRRYMALYPDRVRWVFKHYPLRVAHPHAALAHEAAVAAQEQGKFWEMHDLIMRNQANVRYADLVRYAEEIGLDLAAFKDALDTRKYRPRVIRDMEQARHLRVAATPTYFVNGFRFMGARTANGFRSLFDAVTGQPGAAPARPDADADAADSPPGAPANGSGSASPR